MITYIYIDRSGHKNARPVKNRKALMALRNSSSNLRNLQSYREGHKEAKANLLQLAYNARPVNGVLAGCKHYSSTFFHDIDCYNRDQAEQYKSQILSKKEEIGLLMLERSPSGGWHLVCRRERGKTILENQVRVATILQIEMDTNAKDLQRVVYSTSGSEEDLPYLDDAIFEEPMTVEESAAEYQVLKDREKQRLEEIPPEAKKANKHYKPWENTHQTLIPLALKVCRIRKLLRNGGVCMVENHRKESVILLCINWLCICVPSVTIRPTGYCRSFLTTVWTHER